MGCSVQKKKDNHQKNVVSTSYIQQQIIIQNEMPDSNREFFIQIKITSKTKGMVHRYNQMYPDRNQSLVVEQKIQEVPSILNNQNVSKSTQIQLGNTRDSQQANYDSPNLNKSICIQNNQNLRSLIKSNIPQVSKQQKNVTFQLKKLIRSPDKQSKKRRVTLKHLERIF